MWSRCWVVGLLLVTSSARAQAEGAPPPAETTPLPPQDDFVPFVPPATTEPAPVPAEAPPAPAPDTLPPGVQVTPMAPPPTSEAPVATPPRRVAPQGDCKGARGKGFFHGTIPTWAGGAAVGAAVGALGFSLVGLALAAALNLAILRAWIASPPSSLPGVFMLPLAALPLGAVLGAVVGGVVAPFLPNIPLTRPCLEEPGSDPTQRRSGDTGTGSGTAT